MRLFLFLSPFFVSLSLDICCDINIADIRIRVCALSCTSLALFVDEELLDAQADLVAVLVEVNDLGCDFLAGLQNI